MKGDPPEYSVICSAIEIEKETDLSELVLEISHLDFPEALRWQDTYVDPESLDDFQLTISTGSPETPSFEVGSDRSVFLAEMIKDQGLHIHSYIHADVFSELVELHNTIGGLSDGLRINHGSVSIQLPEDIDNYELSIQHPLDATFNGIELNTESGSVSLFRHSESSFLSYTNFESAGDTVDIEEYIYNTKSIAQELLEEIEP